MEVIRDRKCLHTLQPDATDKENLVGAGRTAPVGKQGIKEDLKMKGDVKKITEKVEPTKKHLEKSKTDKKVVQKETKLKASKEQSVQTETGQKVKIEAADLTSEAGPSENYWEVIAERRRIALDDALHENRELIERIERLEEANRVYKEMLDESRALVEVLQEMIGEDGNGINNSLDDSAL